MLAFAAFSNPFETCAPNGVATLNCVPNIFPTILTLAIVLAFIAALILIIFSGIKFITSGGDEKQVEGARKTLTFAIIGLVVVLASFFIVQTIGRQTGVNCISVFGFNSCQNATPSFVACSDKNPPPKGACRNPEDSCTQVGGHWACHRD